MEDPGYDPFLAVDIYDLIYRHRPAADVQRFDRCIRAHGGEGGRLIDVGCGTGAHLVHYRRAGYEVAGLDASEAMLARARARAELAGAPLLLGDMRSFLPGAAYDVAVCHSLSILHNTSLADLRRTFESVAAMLRPGGVFVFDVVGPRYAGEPGPAEDGPEEEVALDASSPIFARYGDEVELGYDVRWTLDAARGVFVVTFELELAGPDGGERVVRSMEMGAFERDEVLAALAAAGLEPVVESPYEGRSVVLARRGG